MRWLVDARLPRRLVVHLQSMGDVAQHTLDLPVGNATPDALVVEHAQAVGHQNETSEAALRF